LNVHIFLQLLGKIYEHSNIKVKITLIDKSDLKPIFLVKFGYTFYEKYNFIYLHQISNDLRQAYKTNLTQTDLENFQTILWKPFLQTTEYKISDFLEKMEKYYPTKMKTIMSKILSCKFNGYVLPKNMVFCGSKENPNLVRAEEIQRLSLIEKETNLKQKYFYTKSFFVCAGIILGFKFLKKSNKNNAYLQEFLHK
jgi:hypothetical protein